MAVTDATSVPGSSGTSAGNTSGTVPDAAQNVLVAGEPAALLLHAMRLTPSAATQAV
jgi:hypothetical protein